MARHRRPLLGSIFLHTRLRSDGVFESEANFQNLGIIRLDLFAELSQLLVLAFPARRVLILAVVSQLVDLEVVVVGLGHFAHFLEALNL